MAIICCLIIAIGLGVGFGVSAANKSDPPANVNEGGKDGKGVVDAITLLDAKDYSLFGGEEMANTPNAADAGACLDFCKEYDAMQYLDVLKSCTCYNSVTCLMRWGPKVDITNDRLAGDLYVKDEVEECSEDYCQALDDNDGLCFTANSQDYQEYSLYGESIMVERDSQTVETLEECLDLCAPYDAASFLDWKDCTCYDQAECWLEWGDSIDTQLLLGTIFSKKPLDVCAETYCEVIDDSSCFLANTQDCRDYALYGDSIVERATGKTTLQYCLDLCAPYDAAAWGNNGDCGCYDYAQCWLRWGDEVNSENFIGTIYSKTPLPDCERDYCDTVAPDGLCFTANTQPYSSNSLFGNNLEEVASSNDVNNKDECLDFCRKHDAAQFLNFQDPKCKCFSGAECWLAWPPDQTETDGVSYTGDVYSKKELQLCSFDYCSQFTDEQLCAVGNNRQ